MAYGKPLLLTVLTGWILAIGPTYAKDDFREDAPGKQPFHEAVRAVMANEATVLLPHLPHLKNAPTVNPYLRQLPDEFPTAREDRSLLQMPQTPFTMQESWDMNTYEWFPRHRWLFSIPRCPSGARR